MEPDHHEGMCSKLRRAPNGNWRESILHLISRRHIKEAVFENFSNKTINKLDFQTQGNLLLLFTIHPLLCFNLKII